MKVYTYTEKTQKDKEHAEPINSPDPMQTILMVYDGAIKFLNMAVVYSEEGDIRNKNIYINKAADIIVELNNSLNMEVGGEIAENLRALYIFMGRLLVEALTTDKVWALKETIKILSDLKEGWTYVAEVEKERSLNPSIVIGN